MTRFAITAAALMLAAPAFAESHAASGDAAAGEQAFNRQCVTCHNVVDDEGEVLAGRPNMRTGPNLYGIAGGQIASVEDFRYSGLLETAGDQGLEWDEESFVGYVQDPTGWLQDYTGEDGRGKMSYQVRKEEDAVNVWAYLASVGPDEAM